MLRLSIAVVVVAQACFDDAKLCPGGEMLFREPQRNCEFGACFDIDAQMQVRFCGVLCCHANSVAGVHLQL